MPTIKEAKMSEFNDFHTEELIIEESANLKPQLNHIQRIIGIFTKPQEVITDIDRGPKVLIPMILITILTMAVTFISYDTLVETLRITSVNTAKLQGTEIPLDGFVGLSKSIANGVVLASGVVSVIALFIGALITHGISSFMSGEGSIKKVFSASLYVYFSVLAGSVLSGIIALVLKIDLMTISPAALLGADQVGTPLYALLAIFDVFNIWRLAIMVMAIKTIESFSTQKASLIVISITILGLLFQVLPKLGQ